jgi:hypothetical protein
VCTARTSLNPLKLFCPSKKSVKSELRDFREAAEGIGIPGLNHRQKFSKNRQFYRQRQIGTRWNQSDRRLKVSPSSLIYMVKELGEVGEL